MLKSVAIISDTHGVLPALNAALAEPAVRAAERLVVCGDLAAGPQPVAVLDRLRELGDWATLVRGNADRELVAMVDGTEIDVPDPIAPWAAEQLAARPDLVELLRGLPHPVTLPVAGFGDVLFCHGTPRDDEEVVLVDTRTARWTEAFAALPDSVRTVVCGHTHMPFVRLVDGRRVINPGSTGMPYGGAGAHWVVLDDGRITIGVAGFDLAAACADVVANSSYPEAEAWCAEYVYSVNSDVDAITAFGPRDGRPATAT